MVTAAVLSSIPGLLLHVGFFFKEKFLGRPHIHFLSSSVDYNVSWFSHFYKRQLALSSGEAKTKTTRLNRKAGTKAYGLPLHSRLLKSCEFCDSVRSREEIERLKPIIISFAEYQGVSDQDYMQSLPLSVHALYQKFQITQQNESLVSCFYPALHSPPCIISFLQIVLALSMLTLGRKLGCD